MVQYDWSHVPVTRQYEAVGHAVRAVYSYAGMADIAMATGDVDYHGAVLSLWNSIVNRKYYVTGGLGSGETAEGFGREYSLPNHAYCESCAGSGQLFSSTDSAAPISTPGMPISTRKPSTTPSSAAWISKAELHLHQSAGFKRAPLPVARLPLLRRQPAAHAAQPADLDVCEEPRRAPRESVCRQRGPGRGNRRHRGRGRAGNRSSWSGQVALWLKPARLTRFTLWLRVPQRQTANSTRPLRWSVDWSRSRSMVNPFNRGSSAATPGSIGNGRR